jgi:hypothetical protein
MGRSAGVLIRDRVILGRRLHIRSIPSDAYGGVYTGSTDQTSVSVYMSSYYQPDDSVLQSYADLLDGFVHGSELWDVTVYLAPIEEMQAACGSQDTDGCFYGSSNTIYLPGNPPSDGTPVEEIAAHEYGHAIAFARANPYDRTGTALEWGPEYWASLENVCSKVQSGSAFPGDEGSHYMQNPGEAWADTYRMLNGGQPSLWQFDNEFYPNNTDFKYARKDIANPWNGNTVKTASGRFRHHQGPNARYKLDTFDDGPRASVTLTTRGALRASLFMYWQNGSLAAQLRGPQRVKRIRFSICGDSYVRIRVQRQLGFGTYTLAANTP